MVQVSTGDLKSLIYGILGALLLVLVAVGAYYTWRMQHDAATAQEEAQKEAQRQALIQTMTGTATSTPYSRQMTAEERAIVESMSAPAPIPGMQPSPQETEEQRALIESMSAH